MSIANARRRSTGLCALSVRPDPDWPWFDPLPGLPPAPPVAPVPPDGVWASAGSGGEDRGDERARETAWRRSWHLTS